MIWFQVDQEVHNIKIPTIPEITFSSFSDFRDGEAEYVHSDGEPAESDILLCNALSHLITGDLKKIPAHNPGDDLKAMLKSKYQITIGDPLSLERLYISMISMVN